MTASTTPPSKASAPSSAPDGFWYKDAVLYDVFLPSFFDSDGDGVGDLLGLISRLDYIEELGATAICLSPFYLSPMRDGGHDIADFKNIDPRYGTLREFRALLAEAHHRGLRVITDLVLNHTSDQHPWFQRARRAPLGDPLREFYVWAETPKRFREAKVLLHETESSNWAWDDVAGSYYWHRFHSHEPDLNYENPGVCEAMLEVVSFWLKEGVDGLKLRAVPYLYEKDGTNCENLPETHAFLRRLRQHVDSHFDQRILLADVNQWPEDLVRYFGAGDECHMCFNTAITPRLFMAIRSEDRFPIADIIDHTPTIPDECQWAICLRNQDELSLEIVTDEDRDFLYRVYAEDPQARTNLGIRRRLAPLLRNDRRSIELLTTLLFALAGTPVIYYGDEIGMGDNIYLGNCDGVRTPMQWTSDQNAGFSRANPMRLHLPVIPDPEFSYHSINVEGQTQNPHSLLRWTKRLLALRKARPALGRGNLRLVESDNPKTLVFLRSYQDETILVAANLSRFPQALRCNLLECAGMIPIDLLGQTPFPDISDRPYFFSLAPYACMLFELQGDLTLFHSCFISYSTLDTAFAERLYADLSFKGVRCWFAPEDVKIGDRFRKRIHESIREHDKLLLILSENSIRSTWVEDEVESALAREQREKQSILFPVRIDDAIVRSEEAWAETLRNMRHIGDFRDWKSHDSYMKSLARLLRDLKVEKPM